MATVLKNIVRFAGLAVGVPAALPHGLNLDGRALAPEYVTPAKGGFTITVDATNVTVTRNAGADAAVDVAVEFVYSPGRVFDPINDPPAGLPFIQEPGATSGGATAGSALTYRDDAGTIDVFIDAINGSDANDGLTPGTALQTVAELYRKFPWQLLGTTRVLVHLLNATAAPVVYDTPFVHLGSGNDAIQNTYAFRGPAMIQITPATGPATAALDAVPAVQVDQAGAPSGTGPRVRFDFTVAAPGWTVNDLAGSFLRLTRAGAKVVFELPITENTASTLTVDLGGAGAAGLVAAVLNTDTAEIVEPAVAIQNTAGFGLLAIFGQGPAQPTNGATDYSAFERITFGDTWAKACLTLQFDRCKFLGIAFGVQLIDGALSFSNCVSSATMILLGTAAAQAPLRADGGADPIDATLVVDLQVAPRAGSPAHQGVSVGNPSGFLAPGRPGTYAPNNCMAVYRSSVAGIRVGGRGSSLYTQGAITGHGNGNVGLRCVNDATVFVPGGSDTTITGTGGDLRLATGAAIAYGAGVGAFEEVAGYNGNFTRMLEGGAATPASDTSRITTKPIIYF